jgi:hydrogenase nickel incorporation protein HypA/HybF
MIQADPTGKKAWFAILWAFLGIRALRLDAGRDRGNVSGHPMHELGIMESAMASVLRRAADQGATRVHRIVLRVGVLSGAEPDALRFAFEIVARGTPAAEAVLDIDTVPARARCPDCARDFEAGAGFITECPLCHRLCGELLQGRELELARIEMS